VFAEGLLCSAPMSRVLLTEAASPAAFLPEGRRAAVCFTIDDVHPGKSTDAYEAGGDLEKGALGHVARLLDRHPRLYVTLFTTADWREISPVPTRRWLRRIPYVRDRVMLANTHRRGTMRVDRHPAFVDFLKQLPRTEIALHGLHHIHPGEQLLVEFQEQDRAMCMRMLGTAIDIFAAAGLPMVKGMCPPAWNAPPALLEAMDVLDFLYVASARDILTPISVRATTSMSGLRGRSLIYPDTVGARGLVHLTTNFQATSPIERAFEILRAGGLLAIKGHIIKNALGFVMLDGIDGVYCNYLDLLFREIDREFGDSIWWTSMGEVARRVRERREVAAPQAEAARA
jgi:hypothetical protein